MDEPVVEAPCCTRCGARFVSGENFCQQCGCKLSQRSQETVVGGCYGCGTPWRSGWLYCRKCGLDRDQALIGPVSASAEGVSSVATPGVDEPEEVERVPCPSCGKEIRPYSRFCEACGGSISPYSRPIVGQPEPLKTRPEELDRSFRSEDPQIGSGTGEIDGVEVGVAALPTPIRVVPVGQRGPADG
ncbi:MAG: zinc-ribbon domain-containing protein, partial [Proteobacteria bacterium]|nr:zinc-ribbon domain-containing protein [Pseudomonadota bacterium]